MSVGIALCHKKSAVLLVVHCPRYVGTYWLSPILPYTNIVNCFCFRNRTRNEEILV